MLGFYHIAFALQIAVVSVAFCDLLTRPKMVFGWYGTWLDKLSTNEYWGWIAYPIGYCAKCTGGQMAIWLFVVRLVNGSERPSVVLSVSFVLLTVWICEVLSRWTASIR